jgi:cob(I)alamin adenosyltransferase
MKIYTRSGDKGTTSLVYGERVSKADLRVEAYGTCDEANSFIGVAISLLKNETFKDQDSFLHVLKKVQTILFHVGAELATPAGKDVKWKLKEEHIKELEEAIDKYDSQLPPLTNFILPGGSPAGAMLHAARTVVRRAERKSVAIEDGINPFVRQYLNRLSDFLFVAARYVNFQLNDIEPVLHQDF